MCRRLAIADLLNPGDGVVGGPDRSAAPPVGGSAQSLAVLPGHEPNRRARVRGGFRAQTRSESEAQRVV